MRLLKKQLVLLGAVLPLTYIGESASAAPIYGTTAFTNTGTGGFTSSASTSNVPSGGPNSISSGGYSIGNENFYFQTGTVASSDRYSVGYILSPAGTATLSLQSGAPTSAGSTPTAAKSINTSGSLIVGLSDSYVYENAAGTGTVLGNIESVYTTSGTAIPLPVAATDNPSGYPADGPNNSSGLINNGGTVVGTGTVYNPNNGAGVLASSGAFVWTNSGTAASPVYNSYAELLAPGNSTGSITTGSRTETALGISDSGLAVGSGSTYNGSGTLNGSVAVTWDTTSTPVTTPGVVQKTIAPVQLVTPSLASAGSFGGSGSYTYNSANGTGTGTSKLTNAAGYVNSSNRIAGTAVVYDSTTANGTTGYYSTGHYEPVVWNGAGSTGSFLPLVTGYTAGQPTGINTGGDIIGNMQGTSTAVGVLWKGSSYSPTVLAAPAGTNPLTGAAYKSFTFARGVNDSDYTVGYVGSSTGDTIGTNGLVWDPNGNATDLNTLITEVTAGNGTTAGWVSLLNADGISNDGYISGEGVYYDPNATNYNTASISNIPGEYYRDFEILDTAAAPEPTVLLLFGLPMGTGMLMRRRRALQSA